MATFCTYFDRHYLARGISLIRSLQRHSPNAKLLVLCLDDPTRDVIARLGWPEVHAVALAELERADPVLEAAKATRTRLEYYFTCTPAWTRYAMQFVAPDELLVYVDADLWFFSSPDPIFEELGRGSVAIVPHRFPDETSVLSMFGVYNVGFLAFRNNRAGHAVLDDWRTCCIEWCHDRLEDDRFADQKYLDAWPGRFPGVHAVQHPGAGLAPWTWMGHTIDVQRDPPSVDGQPLIFYHFHAFRVLGRWLYDSGLLNGRMPTAVHQRLYDAYAVDLGRSRRLAEQVAPGVAREIPHRRDGVYNYYSGLLRNLVSRSGSVHLMSSRSS